MSTTSESDFIPLPSQASCARPKIGGKKGTNPALPISLGISISESWFLPQPRVKPNHCMYHNQNHFHGRMWDSSCISYLVAKDQGAYVCVWLCVCAYIYMPSDNGCRPLHKWQPGLWQLWRMSFFSKPLVKNPHVGVSLHLPEFGYSYSDHYLEPRRFTSKIFGSHQVDLKSAASKIDPRQSQELGPPIIYPLII